jgi:hypothetical protein
MAGLTQMRPGSINRMRLDRLIELSSSGTRPEKIGTGHRHRYPRERWKPSQTAEQSDEDRLKRS